AATSHVPSPAPPSPQRAASPQAPVPGMPTPGMPGSEVASPQRAASPQVPRLPAPTPEVPSTGVPGSAVVSPQVLSSGVRGPGMPRPGVPGLQEVRVLGLRVPSPGEVAQAPGEWLAWLAGRVAVGLAAMCDPAAEVPFPFGPMAYATNAHCLAYGTAGVVYALYRAGAPVDERLVRRLLDTAAAGADDLPPGLLVGTAGLAWLLADLGHLDAARELLAASDPYRP